MGWVYNLHKPDPNSKVAQVIAICLIFPLLAFLAVILRFYVRRRTERSLWVDDYAVLGSTILTFAYAGITIEQTRWGQGLSEAYFPPENVSQFSKIQYIGGPVYALDLLGFKVALLSSYLRIGGFVDSYRRIIFVAIGIAICNQIAFTVGMILNCVPVAMMWDFSIKGGHCIDSVSFYYALAGTSIGLDLIIISLPLPVLWKLQLKLSQKIVLTCLFALGFFVTVIQIIRIFSVSNLKTYTDSKSLILWSMVEVSLGIIVACIPTYGPLFKVFTSTLSSYRIRNEVPSYPLSKTRRSDRTRSSKHSHRDAFAGDESLFAHTTVVGSGKGDRWSGNSDAESDEQILTADGNMHIHTITEVTVERA